MPFPYPYIQQQKNNFLLKTQILENLQNAGKCIKKKKIADTNSHSTHYNTVIFGQGDPGKTPYNSWGKPVWELLLISEKCFLQCEKYSEKSASKLLQLISFSVLNHYLGKCADSKTEPAINVVHISLKNVPKNYNINFCCTPSSFCVQNNNKCYCTASSECVQMY